MLDIIIPAFEDQEGNSDVTYTVLFNGGAEMPHFARFEEENQVILVDPLSDADYGDYEFTVTIKEVDAP